MRVGRSARGGAVGAAARRECAGRCSGEAWGRAGDFCGRRSGKGSEEGILAVPVRRGGISGEQRRRTALALPLDRPARRAPIVLLLVSVRVGV